MDLWILSSRISATATDLVARLRREEDMRRVGRLKEAAGYADSADRHADDLRGLLDELKAERA